MSSPRDGDDAAHRRATAIWFRVRSDYASLVKRLKLGPLEIAGGVEPREDPNSPQSIEGDAASETDSASWWWEKRKHPLLAEVLVFVLAVGLIAYAARDTHDFFNSAHGVGGFIAALLLVIVIGRRAFRRVARR